MLVESTECVIIRKSGRTEFARQLVLDQEWTDRFGVPAFREVVLKRKKRGKQNYSEAAMQRKRDHNRKTARDKRAAHKIAKWGPESLDLDMRGRKSTNGAPKLP